MINIKELVKAHVLAALYNASRQQGLGVLNETGATPITPESAQKIIDARLAKKLDLYFDYLHGRILKVDLTTDEFDEYLYDRDNGPGAADRAIDAIRPERGM